MRLRLVPIGTACLIAGSLSIVPAVASASPGLAVLDAAEADGPSWGPAISDDGRYVAFVSDAENLLGGDPSADPNDATDVFWVDTVEGTIRLVSAGLGGAPANGSSTAVDLSADGRFVAFESTASNLIEVDANGVLSDVFVFDTADGSLELVSRRGAAGVQGDGDSFAPSISADGTDVAFASDAANLVGTDTNAKTDIFVRALDVSTTTRVSTTTAGAQAKGASYDPVISPDGGWAAFSSLAKNLVNGDTNGTRDVFLKNLSTGKTTRASVRTDGKQGTGASTADDLSLNGKQVVFHSYATNLVNNDGNNTGDVFLRDRVASTTVRVSRDGPTEANGESFGASITTDGTLILFQSWATNLGDDADTNGTASDLFEYTVATKASVRVSVDPEGGWANGASYDAHIAGGGGALAFASIATDLVPEDANGAADVFVHRWVDGSAAVERWSVALPGPV